MRVTCADQDLCIGSERQSVPPKRIYKSMMMGVDIKNARRVAPAGIQSGLVVALAHAGGYVMAVFALQYVPLGLAIRTVEYSLEVLDVALAVTDQ